MYSAVKKRLEISADESTRLTLNSPLPQQGTPSAKRNKFVVKLSPLSANSFHIKPTLNLDTSTTDQGNANSINRLKSPRLARIKIQSLGETNQNSFVRNRYYNMLTEPSPDLIEEDDEQKYFDEIFRKTDREEITGTDQKPKETVGPRANKDFYNHYKKLDKIKDQNAQRDIKDSMFTLALTKSVDLKMLPSKIGLVKEKGVNTSLEINHFRIGDKYAEALGEGLRNNTKINKFELGNNRLTPKGAECILSKISRNAIVIDLSNNSIGKIGCEYISRILEARNTSLQELNLEGNKLGDHSIKLIYDSLESNHELLKINLDRNYLTNACTDKLAATLQRNDTIREMYLYWNQIQGLGGNNLIRGLSANKSLRILDLAWNSLGINSSGFAKNFSDYIAANTDLVVLNLSNNNFSKQDSKSIADGLEKNHTLYEFRFQGNHGYVDCLGFLVVSDQTEIDAVSSHIADHATGKYPNVDLIKRYENLYEEVYDGAWISEGWRPVKFSWSPGISGIASTDPVFLHLVHFGYHAIWLPSHTDFSIELMCPPGLIQYFFTAGGEQVVAEDQPQDYAREALFHGAIYDKTFIAKLHKVNVYQNHIDMRILDTNLEVNCKLKPRIRPEVYIPPEIHKEKIQWALQMSIFKEWKPETDEILKKCFEVDFETSRIQKVVKKPEELEKVKQILFNAYKKLKGAYRYLSSISAAGDVWAIGTNVFTDFLSKCSMIDDTLRLKDADLKFISTYTKSDPALMKNPRNPERMLVRYQFLEIWVRLADQKFISNGIVNTLPEAVEKILNDHILPYINANSNLFLAQKWRDERYWNEQVDTVYKSYLPIMMGLYKKYSGMKTKPGMKKFTCVEELQKLASEASILNDNLVDRDTVVAFNLSMITQVDELSSDRIFQMTFIEFLEAVARLADIYSAPSPGEDELLVSLDLRRSRPLHLKLEGLIHILFNRVCDNSTKDNYILPEKSIFYEPETGAIGPSPKKNSRKRFIVRVDPVAYYFANSGSKIDL